VQSCRKPTAFGHSPDLNALPYLARFFDLVEFPPFDTDDDEEEFGRLVATAEDPSTALTTAEKITGAVPGRWVNESMVQAEYADFVQAGRPTDRSPDGHPWPKREARG
jgi:hypothetical protein